MKKITTWFKCEYPGCNRETDNGYEIKLKYNIGEGKQQKGGLNKILTSSPKKLRPNKPPPKILGPKIKICEECYKRIRRQNEKILR